MPGLKTGSNRPPRVDAGPDQSFPSVTEFPVNLALDATVTDDGQPAGRLIYRWTQTGGPGPVVIEAADQRVTRVRLPGQGTYTLRLSVSDGALTGSDEVVLTAARSGGEATWVAKGSVWRYLDTGVDPTSAWRTPGFNDSAWKSGKGVLGYGDAGQATPVGFGPNSGAKFITTYFRSKFTVADPASVTALTAQVLRDDGMVVWLNGVQAAKDNLPEGDIGPGTLANSAIGGADETTYFEYRLDPALLRAGENTLAVEVHQNAASSSDLGFDLALVAMVLPSNRAPTVSLGGERLLSAPGTVVLDAQFSDDGLPLPPGVPAFAWTQVSGPGAVGFSDPKSPRTSATFDRPGNYVVAFEAADGVLTTRQELRLQVGSESRRPLVSIEAGLDGLTLRFDAEAGRAHAVEVCEDLATPVWKVLEQVPAVSQAATRRIPVPLSGQARFFRVVVR
jgi:hypothetical protein